MRELRHTCICLCTTCESLGCGAFGKQPDGAEPLQIEAAQTDESSASAAGYQAVPVLHLALMVEAPKLDPVRP